MVVSTMMWLFIIGHVVSLAVLGWLLARMNVTTDAEIGETAEAEEVI